MSPKFGFLSLVVVERGLTLITLGCKTHCKELSFLPRKAPVRAFCNCQVQIPTSTPGKNKAYTTTTNKGRGKKDNKLNKAAPKMAVLYHQNLSSMASASFGIVKFPTDASPCTPSKIFSIVFWVHIFLGKREIYFFLGSGDGSNELKGNLLATVGKGIAVYC